MFCRLYGFKQYGLRPGWCTMLRMDWKLHHSSYNLIRTISPEQQIVFNNKAITPDATSLHRTYSYSYSYSFNGVEIVNIEQRKDNVQRM